MSVTWLDHEDGEPGTRPGYWRVKEGCHGGGLLTIYLPDPEAAP